VKKYFKLSGKILLYLIIYQFFMYLYSAIIGAVLGFRMAMNNPNVVQQNLVAEQVKQMMIPKMYIPIMLSAITSLGVYYLIYKKRNKSLIEVCNFSKVNFKSVGLAAIIGIAYSLFVRYILFLVSKSSTFAETYNKYGEMMKWITNYDILNILTVVLIAPVVEEVLFRGMIFNELLQNISLVSSIIIQALLFGLYHMNIIQGLYAFVMALFLGILYYRFKSLWVPIIFHSAFNAVGIINSNLFQSIWIFLISIFMLLIGFILLNKDKGVLIENMDSSIN
jgi:membrane protease YdiL (CAAX protease family)